MTDLVIDTSAAVRLSQNGSNGTITGNLYAPELIDLEFASTVRKLVLRRELTSGSADAQMTEWFANRVVRCSHRLLLPRIWQLRHNITPYDSAYVALAETLGVPLVTADQRLARAAARYCEILVPD